MPARAGEGAGSILLISGEAGIGKTRLCAELSRWHQQRGGRVLLGRAVPEEASLPYTALAIARRLFLSRPTVASHVAHILTKLDFSSRAQIAAWVAQRRASST